MMDVFEAMGSARSMRWLRPDPVPSELVDRLLWAATRASNPGNSQGWDFVVVQHPDVRRQIGDLFAPKVPTSELPPVDDPTERRTRDGALNLLARMGEVPVLVFVCGANIFPTPEAPDIAFLHSAMYAAAQNLLVAARALGLGSAFTTFHRAVEPELRALLGIPDDRTIGVTMPVGWPDRPFGPLTRRPVEDVVHHDRW